MLGAGRAAPSYLLQRSGQLWKLNAASAALYVSALLLLVALFGDGSWMTAGMRFVVSMCGLITGVAAFGWPSLSIRCPGCRARLFWYALSKRRLTIPDAWLRELQECPFCGYPR